MWGTVQFILACDCDCHGKMTLLCRGRYNLCCCQLLLVGALTDECDRVAFYSTSPLLQHKATLPFTHVTRVVRALAAMVS